MIELAQGFGRGKWRKIGGAIFVHCPQCNFCASLNHEIAVDGVVTPSVECPRDCGFHESVKLLGWISDKTISARA